MQSAGLVGFPYSCVTGAETRRGRFNNKYNREYHTKDFLQEHVLLKEGGAEMPVRHALTRDGEE